MQGKSLHNTARKYTVPVIIDTLRTKAVVGIWAAYAAADNLMCTVRAWRIAIMFPRKLEWDFWNVVPLEEIWLSESLHIESTHGQTGTGNTVQSALAMEL
ncbi:hypothetical protein BTUL_0007g00580 [Botrytis tulipae]|uniref:Uncharacterized protein n=1 Tax=Botrytis tulipae TaxID=87230 RepID=A0A4Z1F5A3_9HELO|nr:hypothetical protein BTUL_0007g00580 [Botrytis tulipae]